VTRKMLASLLAAFLPAALIAETVTVPFGTTVFCELEERVTSKKKETSEGDIVRAHVWKDVRVGDQVVIEGGTPVFVRVSKVKKARLAGQKGKLELEALNVPAVDGHDVPLDGGYDRSGRGKMGLSIALAAVVAWPLIFLKGKQAVLEPGTVFDAMVRSAIEVNVPGKVSTPKIKVSGGLVVTILYDEMDPDSKITDLPLELRADEGEITQAEIVSVNGESMPPMPIRITGTPESSVYRGSVEFKPLSKHFAKGMNRFEVRAGEATAEVLLEIEL
jgi:hypothetical protein